MKLILASRIAAASAFLVIVAGVASAQDEETKKKKKGQKAPFGLLSVADLTEKLKLDEDQVKQVIELYKSFSAKKKELQKRAKEQPDQKKALGKERKGLKAKVIAGLKEIANDDQDKIIDELFKKKKKKKKKEKKPPDNT